jgi:hypothetical protein
MADVLSVFGGDLAISATGDLQTVEGDSLTRQRIILRMLTNQGDYLWHLDYGAGLGGYVGSPDTLQGILSVARAQIHLEASVAKSPPPSITASVQSNNTVLLSVLYSGESSGQTSTLTVTV